MKKILTTAIIFLIASLIFWVFPFQIKAHSGDVLSAWSFDVPIIDGIVSSTEWNDAAKVTFCLTYDVLEDPSRSTFPLVRESHECTLFVKNDGTYLYMAIIIKNEDYSLNDRIDIFFDNDHDGILEHGDNVLSSLWQDAHLRWLPGWYWGPDELWGGTNDLLFARSHTNPSEIGDWSFEFRQPLNSDDDDHDFSLAVGDTVGFAIWYVDFVPTPEHPTAGWSSTFPDQGSIPLDASKYADIVIHLPPRYLGEYRITAYAYPEEADDEYFPDNSPRSSIWIVRKNGSVIKVLVKVPFLIAMRMQGGGLVNDNPQKYEHLVQMEWKKGQMTGRFVEIDKVIGSQGRELIPYRSIAKPKYLKELEYGDNGYFVVSGTSEKYEFSVDDTLGRPRYYRQVDFWLGVGKKAYHEALKWGVKRANLYVYR